MNRFFKIIFVIVAIILLLHWLTSLEVTDFRVLAILIFLLSSIACILLFNFYFKKISIPGYLIIIFIAFIFPYLSIRNKRGGDWKTQEIAYQNKHFKNRTIEFQMKDRGYGEFNERVIDKIKIIPFIIWVKPANQTKYDTLNWKEVNIVVKKPWN